MVRCLPSERHNAGDADTLFFEINRAAPFQIGRGDFTVTRSRDGQTCWVALGDAKRTKEFVGFLKSSPDWKYSTTGSVRTSARKSFGLAAKAATYNRDGSIKRQGEFAAVNRADWMEMF